MTEKEKILNAMDRSVDAMDTEEIGRCLDALAAMEKNPIPAEAPEIFAERIRVICRKENKDMKPKKYLKIAAVAALISITCLTAYAAGGRRLFSFVQNGKFITMRTSEQNLSEDQAKDMTSGPQLTPGEAENQEVLKANPENFTFDDRDQAQRQMDMPLVVPQKTDEMKLDSATGSVTEFGDGVLSKTVWLVYSDQSGRMLGVTESVEVIPADSSITSYTEHDMDEGSLGSYTSKSGVEFTLLTESDDSGERTAHIATALLGDYEYSVIFFGFDEAERLAILDGMDLSVYE